MINVFFDRTQLKKNEFTLTTDNEKIEFILPKDFIIEIFNEEPDLSDDFSCDLSSGSSNSSSNNLSNDLSENLK